MLVKRKDGQVTVFIILGILILIIVSVLLYFNSLSVGDFKDEIVSSDLNSVQLYVDSCLETSSEEALRYVF